MIYILSVCYLIFTSLGVLFMKLGGNSLNVSFVNGFTFKIGLFTFIGFACYLVSFILWQKLLTSYNISFIVPLMTGLAQIISCVIGFTIFKEQITVFNIIGIVLIICGVTTLSIKGLK